MTSMEEAWEATLRTAHVTTDGEPWQPARYVRRDGVSWRVSLSEHSQVQFDRTASDHFGFLADAWSGNEGGPSLHDRIGKEQVLREVVYRAGQTAADAELYGIAAPDWPTISADISRALSVAVVAVPIGGAFSDAIGAHGYATPITIGTRVVAGHLDDTFEEMAQPLARSLGLPGFRFSDESWWTEDLIAAHVDDETEHEGSWPWLIFAWALPVSGVAAEHAAVIASEALLGTLVLLDHIPGGHWGRFVPWIPGCPSRAGNPYLPDVINSDNAINTDPQRVDGRLERLASATTSSVFTAPLEIDVGIHAAGPASALLAAVADAASNGQSGDAEHNWKLASGCRLAYAASAATASDVRLTLAGRAIELLSGSIGTTVPEYTRLSRIGHRWRVERNSQWPPSGQMWAPQTLDEEQWRQSLPTYDQLRAMQDNTRNLPTWALERVRDAEVAMNALQATLFGLAALLND